MKKFRSSKLLKPVDLQTKQQASLRTKIKQLEEQIELLQKQNLNIYIPVSEHSTQGHINYEIIINKLKVQIVGMEKENSHLKVALKKQQKEVEKLKAIHAGEIKNMKALIDQLKEKIIGLDEEIEQVSEMYQEKKLKCDEMEKEVIQKNVEIKFLKEDLDQQKKRIRDLQEKVRDYNEKISAVVFSSRIYQSKEKEMVCLEMKEYQDLKDKIWKLESKVESLMEANRRDLITLGVKKSDIGQEIVRLKKNIDLQLGLQGESKHSQQFLKIYKGTNELFTQLISQCKP